ncbi:Flagellar hook-length control protein FliK [Myxococcus hansupus]|uniref:Flagellar hook-length control protein FliK n=1 Tax=Pseudomyxococcus hansupus TaxID=1297742 RepID=A0A0H4WXP7_9BACT|nr:Flagellar hook-length control protein FliK [Myxococcus hansupus]
MIVFDVGQGNLNAIVDGGGKIVAYYDFGYSTEKGKFPTPPTKPCFCDDPLIILSHWDQDHINLSKHVTRCLSAEWLVPEQGHSTFATKLQKRIKQAGGRLHTVPYSNQVQHQVFPWGYVERCSGAQTDPNGSGMAAFICVRQSPQHPAPAVGVAAVNGVASSALSPFLVRARAAHGLVTGSVNANIGLLHRPAVQRVALPVATVLAASQTAAGRQPHLPVAECVLAAVRAAERVVVHAENAVTAAGWLNGHNTFPTLRLHNAGWANTVAQELASATVAAAAPALHSYPGRVRAACGALTRDGTIEPGAWTWLGVRAAAAPGAPPPQLNTGHAPHHTDERFILLNGDAEYQYVPSMQQPKRPRVVAMTAMHHGAIYECTTHLQGRSIPFAPGSRAAQAVLRFRTRRVNAAGGLTNSVVSAVTEAALSLQRRRKSNRRRELRVNISRVARAAATAVYALNRAHPNEVTASPGKFAAVAAAVTIAAWRYPDATIVGLAACLASTTQSVSTKTGTSPIESVVEVAARAIRGRRVGPALTDAQLTNISAGALDGDLIPHVDHLANALVGTGQQLLTPDNAGAEAASALGELWASYKHGLAPGKAKDFKQRMDLDNADENVLNDLATAATAAIQASANGRSNRHRVAKASNAAGTALTVGAGQFVALAGQVQGAVSASYWAAPGLVLDAIAHAAAKLAAERAAAYLVGSTVEAVRTVIESARTPALRHDAYHAFGSRFLRANGSGGQIAYSYGIDADGFSHGYAKQTVSAGYCGHAHPLAIYKYEARGWVWRYNTSTRSRHKGAQGDPDRSHPFGHVRLAWDSVRDAAPSRDVSDFKCKTCGKSYRLQG